MCLGVPGRVVEISDQSGRLALVDFGGVRRRVDLACVLDGVAEPSELVGCWVLVHVGFAMSVIDEQEAAATLALLDEIGALAEEVGEMERAAG